MKKLLLSVSVLLMGAASYAQFFAEDFENGGVFPADWALTNGSDDWAIDQGDDYGPGAAQSGTYCAFFDDYSYSSGTTADMVTPRIDLTGSVNAELKFWYWDGSQSDNVQVLWSTDSSTWNPIASTGAIVSSWTEYTYNLSFVDNEDSVWIAFRGTSIWGSTNPHVDNIIVANAPTCPDPSSIVLEDVFADSASLSWTDNAGASEWYVQYGADGFTPGTGMFATSLNDSIGLNGLMPTTAYDFYVKAVCAVGDSSEWIGPFDFTTTATCPDPSSIVLEDVFADSASLSWTDNAGASEWYVQYGADGFTPGTGMFATSLNDSIGLNGLMPTTAYDFYVKAVCAVGDSSEWIGPFDFTTIATCPDPSSIVLEDVFADSASLSWTDNAGASEWYVQYGVDGFMPGTGMFATSLNDSIGLNGLMPATDYDFYVKAVCAVGDSSEWIGPFSFTTDCGNITPPYVQDFANYIPNCWQEASGRFSGVMSLTPGSSNWSDEDYANVGSNSAYLNLYGTGRDEWLMSPVFDLGAGATNYQVEFDIALTEYDETFGGTLGSDDTLAFVISTDSGKTWNPANILAQWDATNNTLTPSGTRVVLDLTGYTSYVRFAYYGASSVSNEDNDIFIDNFEIKARPACPQPSLLSVTDLASDTANLNWVESGSATEWDIEYDTTGFTIGTGNGTIGTSTTNNPYKATGLTAQTTYDFYVRAICGAGDTSVWAGPFTFTTPCLPTVGDSATDAIIVSSLPYADTNDNSSCYTDNNSFNSDSPDVWYRIITDECSDTVNASLCDSADFDTYLTVYEGSALNYVDDNDDDCGLKSNLTLYAGTDYTAGDTLYILAEGYDDEEFGVFILNITEGVNPLDLTVTSSMDTGMVVDSNSSYTYQWLDCDNGDTAITGANMAWYKANVSGNYSVIIDNGTCADTSACVALSVVGINDIEALSFSVYPNPNNGAFTLTTNSKDLMNVEVISTVGQVVYKSTINNNMSNIDLRNVSNGTYVIRVYNDKVSSQEKLIIK